MPRHGMGRISLPSLRNAIGRVLRSYGKLRGVWRSTYRPPSSGVQEAFWVLFYRPLKMGPIGCPETSLRNYHHMLRNIPEERIYHLLNDRGMKSRVVVRRFLRSEFNL